MNTLTYYDLKRLIHNNILDISFNRNVYKYKSKYFEKFVKENNGSDYLLSLNENDPKFITEVDYLLKNYIFNGNLDSMVDIGRNDLDILNDNTSLNNFVYLKPRFIDELFTITNKDNNLIKCIKYLGNVFFRRNFQIPFKDKINEVHLGAIIECKKDCDAFIFITIKPKYKHLNYTILNNMVRMRKGTIIDRVLVHCNNDSGFFLPFQDIFNIEIIK